MKLKLLFKNLSFLEKTEKQIFENKNIKLKLLT